METKEQTSLRFHGISIIDLHFTSLQVYSPNVENKISLDIRPKVLYPKDSNLSFKILMEISLEAKDYFDLNFFAVGSFDMAGEVIEEIKRNFVNVNAPAIMFPYIRSFISTLTSNLGLPTGTIIIPPQFLTGNLPEAIETDSAK